MKRPLATLLLACLLGLGSTLPALAATTDPVNPQPQPNPPGTVAPPPSDDVRTPAPGDALPNTGTDSRPGEIGGAIDMPGSDKSIRKHDTPPTTPPGRQDPTNPTPPIK